MSYSRLRAMVPAFLRAQIFHFENEIEERVRAFAAQLAPATLLLDAGAGEGQYRAYFPHCRYVGVDLAVGDRAWNYSRLEARADLLQLPFRDASFKAFLSVVTLEHVIDPGLALAEMARTAEPGARLLLVVPHEWEVHQHPHDYFRFTRYGIEHLLDASAWQVQSITPGGGFFRLLSRRLMNSLQFFPGYLMPLLALGVVPLALVVAGLDFLDQKRDYTLGYFVQAVKR